MTRMTNDTGRYHQAIWQRRLRCKRKFWWYCCQWHKLRIRPRTSQKWWRNVNAMVSSEVDSIFKFLLLNIAFATHGVEQGPQAGRGVDDHSDIGWELPGVDGQGGAVTCIRHQRQSLPLCWATTIRGDSPSAPSVHVGDHSNWRAAAPTVFVLYFAAIHTNLLQDLTPASTHAQLIHFHKISDSTHSITFKSSESNSSFPFESSGSIRASGLLALVPSGPRALPHPGFVPYPIPGLGYILHIFSCTTRPSMCSYHVRGSISDLHFLFSPSPCDLPVSCCFATSIVRSCSTGWPSVLIHFHEFRPKSLTHSQEIGLDSSFPPTNSDSTHSSLSWRSLDSHIHFQQFRIESLSRFQEFILDSLNQYQRSTQYRI